MYIKIENHTDDTVKIIDYPGDMKMFLWAHSFGVYNIIKLKPGVFQFVDRFSLAPALTISKPGKREIAAFERSKIENEY